MKDIDEPDANKNKDPKVEAAKSIINRYRNNYKSINPEVLFNLSELKELSSQPKTDTPDTTADAIEKHLGAAESSETLRQERWRGKVHCPFCNSRHIKRLSLEEQKTQDNYKYLCIDCKKTFNDDSETKIETGVPPVHTWMFCWYLLGCSNSLQYIANRLGLPLATIEMMVQHMQRLFKTNEPMKHFMSFDEWSLKQGKSYKLAMQEALAKQTERFVGFSVGQEKDTAEVRRHKNSSKPTPKF